MKMIAEHFSIRRIGFVLSLLTLTLLDCNFNVGNVDSRTLVKTEPSESRTTELQSSSEENRFPESVRTLRAVLPLGSTVTAVLIKKGIEVEDAFEIGNQFAQISDMRNVKSGMEIFIGYSAENIPVEVRIPLRYDQAVLARWNEKGWTSEFQFIDVYPVPTSISAVITDSLFQTALDNGIPLSIMMDAVQLFSFDFDLQRDLHPGNKVKLLYERIENESGELLASGNLLYASLTNNEKTFETWRYKTILGREDYYQKGGQSVRKSMLKTPVNGARITSRFGIRRHPIRGYTSFHRGTDFAVPTGTPIRAGGDGVIKFAGWHNQYGNVVIIRHKNHYETLYAHMSGFARKTARTGRTVKQGSVIGYVGSTGQSTGPHCHYEIRYYGKPINPSRLKFPSAQQLGKEDLRLFDLQIKALSAEFGL